MHTIANLIINLGFEVKDNVIITFANNPSDIPCNIRIANAISNTSSLISCIFGTKNTLLAKKGLFKRLMSK
jgi:hypothetical protein